MIFIKSPSHRVFLLIPLLILLGSLAFGAQPQNVLSGNIQVTVKDEQGHVLPEAPVYISDDCGTPVRDGKNVPGTLLFALPAGSYCLSSALAFKTPGGWDRSASPDARVDVVPGETLSIILVLRPLPTEPELPAVALLRTMGLDPTLITSLQ